MFAWRAVLGLEIPGGLVDKDEGPAEVAARELREETGCRAGQVKSTRPKEPLTAANAPSLREERDLRP